MHVRGKHAAGALCALLLCAVLMVQSTGLAQAATATVTGKYKSVRVTQKVKLTDSASMEVNPQEDYIKILKVADLGNGLQLKVKDKDDFMTVRQSETTEARKNNEEAIRRAKADRHDKEILAKAQRQAAARAEKKYKNIWQLPSQTMDLPKATDGATKTYMSYKAVTAKGSSQYQLLHAEKAYTKNGFRMYDGWYCVAMGSYYSDQIGTKFYVKLSSGRTLRCILGDQKADRHTDAAHQYAEKNKDILEFIVDGLELPGGDVSAVDGFEGRVVSIRKITDDHTDTMPYGCKAY